MEQVHHNILSNIPLLQTLFAISNLGMISSILPKTKMNFVKSSNFYGSLKLVKRHFLWTTSVATRSLKRVNFVTSSEVLVKTTCKFTVDHIHILRLFALVKKMVNSCVAANCTNKACLSSGISVHTIPYYNDDRPEAKRRRKIWVDFVKAKRVFEPSTLCSIHFLPEDYERRFSSLPNQTKPNHPRLKRDDLGICVYPSIHAVPTKHASEPDTQSPRDRRMVSLLNFLHDFFQFFRVVSNVYCIAFNYVIIYRIYML
jgi:hypothetical protein